MSGRDRRAASDRARSQCDRLPEHDAAECGQIKPLIKLNSVDFPAPFGPITVVIAFGSAEKYTIHRANAAEGGTKALNLKNSSHRLPHPAG
jgi:hypothetical protein